MMALMCVAVRIHVAVPGYVETLVHVAASHTAALVRVVALVHMAAPVLGS